MKPLNADVVGLRPTLEVLTRVCGLLLAALCVSVTAAAQTTEFVELASPNAAGTNAGNARSTLPQTSADGRFIVFTSDAGDLVANDANSASDVFVRDLQTDTTRLVSVNNAGTGSGNGLSLAASITPDGRFVLFGSDASDLVANDTNGASDVFVRDLQTDTTRLVSVNNAGNASGGGGSSPGFITPDGRFAVFNSAAIDLVAGVGAVNQIVNVYRRDLQAGTTVMVSVNTSGTSSGNGHSTAQALTPDGRFVLFQSSASDLTANDTNGSTSDIFRRDLQGGATTLASVNSAGSGSGNNAASEGVMSDDGRVVAFTSLATDLLPPPGPGRTYTTPGVYEHDFDANTTKLVSEVQVFETGTVMTVPPARLPRVSADGRYIFYLRYENFIGGLNRLGFRDRIFRRDRQTGDLFELPFVAAGLCDLGFNCRSIVEEYVTSPDGRYVAYGQFERPRLNAEPYSTSIVIRDMVGGGAEIVRGLPGVPFNMPGAIPRILRPGNVVAGGKLAFSSGVAHVAADTNGFEDVYLYAPPSQNRMAFNQSSYSISEPGSVLFTQVVRVRRAGYLINSTVTVNFDTSNGTATAGSDYATRSETLTFAPGETDKLLAIQIFNDEVIDPDETVTLTLSGPTGNAILGTRSVATLTIEDDDPHLFLFSASDYEVSEAGFSLLVTVTVSGAPTVPVSVAYSTSDGTASERSDYVTARGRLTFAPGERAKTFRLLVVNDVFVEGDETVNLTLSDPKGGILTNGGTGSSAVVRITSDDSAAPTSNPIDASDFFVRQHYSDFLNRLPDADGYAFWQNEIESCGPSAQCREVKRINVSAAFFLSIEFQTTGYLAYLTNKAAFGTRPLYSNFMYDVQTLQRDFVFGEDGAEARLEANKRAYFDEFVTRTAFIARYAGMNNADYVGALLNDNGLSPTVGNLFVSRLDAAQVVPQTGSGATGVVIIRRDPTGGGPGATVSLSLRNLTGSPTAVHVHGPAAQGANSPAIITFPAGEFADFRLTLTGEQINWLNTGQLYIDVHTQGFPDGEIRARLGPTLFRGDVLTSALDNQILTRAQVLRAVAEFDELKAAELNSAFVLMEYFGYLRRDPDEDGYNFWLGKLDSFNGDYVRAEMVKAFINSAEYRQRFGP
jgi:Tol biopolymer transport system component